jgi:hypothetical protein
VGGCLGGGGEPKSMDPLVLQQRMQAVYAIDAQAQRRRSYENPDVQKLYATELREAGSARARELLHTSYAARGSARLLLMRLLDCVDRRDGKAAASLFHPDATWSTASAFGEIRGRAGIESFVASRLPPRLQGPAYARHRMASASAAEDLAVLTPAGERCRFRVEMDRSRRVIRRLVREPA